MHMTVRFKSMLDNADYQLQENGRGGGGGIGRHRSHSSVRSGNCFWLTSVLILLFGIAVGGTSVWFIMRDREHSSDSGESLDAGSDPPSPKHDDHHRHGHGGIPEPTPVDGVHLTIFHTTDVHGFIAGHEHPASLNADFGDLLSLLTRAREDAAAANKASGDATEQVLAFDSGDEMEGTGLSDMTEPVHGSFIFDTFARVPYDGLTIGNHDAGHAKTVAYLHDTTVPAYNTKDNSGTGADYTVRDKHPHYVTSNTFFVKNTADKNSGFAGVADGRLTYLGAPYSVFTLTSGHIVAHLGLIYKFEQTAPNIVCLDPLPSIQLPVFDQMWATRPDVLVLTVHIAPHDPSLDAIVAYVRARSPSLPIVFLCGHRHERKFRFDFPSAGDGGTATAAAAAMVTAHNNTWAIEDGRYFETLGVIKLTLPRKEKSATLPPATLALVDVADDADAKKGTKNDKDWRPQPVLAFSHTWVDATKRNLRDLVHRTTQDEFDTKAGTALSARIRAKFEELHLSDLFGCSSLTYGKYPGPFEGAYNIWSLLFFNIIPQTRVLPTGGGSNGVPGGLPPTNNTQLYVTNPFSLRTPLFEGDVTRNAFQALLPFSDTMMLFKDVPGHVVSSLLSWYKRENPHPQQGGTGTDKGHKKKKKKTVLKCVHGKPVEVPVDGADGGAADVVADGDVTTTTTTTTTTTMPQYASPEATRFYSMLAVDSDMWQEHDAHHYRPVDQGTDADNVDSDIVTPQQLELQQRQQVWLDNAQEEPTKKKQKRDDGHDDKHMHIHNGKVERACTQDQVCFYSNVKQSAILTDEGVFYDIITNGYDAETLTLVMENEFPCVLPTLAKPVPYTAPCGNSMKACFLTYMKRWMQYDSKPHVCGPYGRPTVDKKEKKEHHEDSRR